MNGSPERMAQSAGDTLEARIRASTSRSPISGFGKSRTVIASGGP
ncbi:MAG: hypothetical protein Q7T08_09830 [Devosia sp.]|nr:hypothetical protein [Devosia sp.]